jgi:hypothetical protein
LFLGVGHVRVTDIVQPPSQPLDEAAVARLTDRPRGKVTVKGNPKGPGWLLIGGRHLLAALQGLMERGDLPRTHEVAAFMFAPGVNDQDALLLAGGADRAGAGSSHQGEAKRALPSAVHGQFPPPAFLAPGAPPVLGKKRKKVKKQPLTAEQAKVTVTEEDVPDGAERNALLYLCVVDGADQGVCPPPHHPPPALPRGHTSGDIDRFHQQWPPPPSV